MTRTILLTSNDHVTRELVAKFFHSHGFICASANCDEKLLTHINAVRPKILISEISLRSRFHSLQDHEAAFSLLLAARCRVSLLPVFLLNKSHSPELEKRSGQLGFKDYFEYPLDLSRLLGRVRAELRRISRLKNYSRDFYRESEMRGTRGRPCKYPEITPDSAGSKKHAASAEVAA